jgi:PAS domain S-box-containing protein
MPTPVYSLNRLLNHPWRILGIVLAVVFAVEAVVMLVLPLIIRESVDARIRALIDATLLTLISAPVLWWIIIGPLRRIAITEQIRSETITSNAGEGIITIDRIGTILSFNRAASTLFGCRAEEVVSKPLTSLIPDLKIGATQTNHPTEYKGLHASGESFPAALSVRPIPTEADDAFVVIVRDMTESRRAEESRVVAAREKESLRAQQMATLAQLATEFAHEVRNPLTSVKMLVQANRAQLENDGLRSEDLELVEKEIRRIERSVNTFLEFARPAPSERKIIELARAIQQTRDLLEGRAESKGVTINVDGDSMTTNVMADSEQLLQLFLNLGLNALDAMPQGGVLRFRIGKDDDGVFVEVCDTGTGIEQKMVERLFSPFSTTKKNGLGLGLGICRRIAEDHGGRLDGKNLPNGGAKFTLSLPASAQIDHEVS